MSREILKDMKVSVAKKVENQKPQPVELVEFQLVLRKKTRKANDTNIEGLKAKLQDKGLIVFVGEEWVAETRKTIWSEIMKNVSAPRIRGTIVLLKGDLLVKLADEKICGALREIQQECRILVREEGWHGSRSLFMRRYYYLLLLFWF